MKHYWKSLAAREAGAACRREAETEFAETPLQIPAGPDRRGFLKACGFTFGAASLAGCRRAPVHKAQPHLVQPEGMVAGRPVYYASTCAGCTAGCGLLVKTRDGRPIKLEGNPEHPVSHGGTCAVGQASILAVYDVQRLKGPLASGKSTTWAEVDRAMQQIRGPVRFLSQTITSPTAARAIARFLSRFQNARHVVWDPLSCSAILDAHARTHGRRVLPRYRFERAETVVSFDADFLGTWISPVEFARAYAAQDPYHVQYEGRLSITGSKADRRIPTAPGEMRRAMTGLKLDDLPRGRSLVVCGADDVELQIQANEINRKLESYGATLDIERPSLQRQGDDAELERLLDEVDRGEVGALLIYGLNPAYDLPRLNLKKVPLLVSFAERLDETAALAHYVCPDHNALESWGDAEPVSGTGSIYQPTVRPLGNTRAMVESLAAWSGAPTPAYEQVRETWRTEVFPRQTADKDFEDFWRRSVRDGFAQLEPRRIAAAAPKPTRTPPPAAQGEFELVLYSKAALLDGRHAYNPWLQELPDPITKATWDNYACLAPATAARLGLGDGDGVRLNHVELPVLIQPGQHERVVAVAIGYGRNESARFAQIGPRWLEARRTTGDNGLVGVNVAPLRDVRAVNLQPTGKRHRLALTQEHHTINPKERPLIQETGDHPHHPPAAELWPRDHAFPKHRWAMAIDLNACTGCSACVLACQIENNIPVVGKDEVARNREMHWIRIDRYYSGPSEAPQVAHQPVMCQQCEHAPCETVCPVLATVHSSEGLNQQVYNRCVGTRYCANNCPYKTRRFNWFDYAREANMVLNPDVTARSRGVMEKCTFCVQRIQEAKLEAKRRGEPLKDGDIQTACQQSCPAGAIVFGDLNDPNSRISRLAKDGRAYRLLEEINVRPSVSYLKVVRHV